MNSSARYRPDAFGVWELFATALPLVVVIVVFCTYKAPQDDDEAPALKAPVAAIQTASQAAAVTSKALERP